MFKISKSISYFSKRFMSTTSDKIIKLELLTGENKG